MSDRLDQREARREVLLQAFPRLLHGGLPYLEYGPGWDRIIHDLLQQMDGLLHDEFVSAFRIVQIKEKFGTLRLYYRVHGQGPVHVDVQDADDEGLSMHLVVGGVTDRSFPGEEIDRLIEDATTLTAQTCESCGRAGILRRHGSLLTTLCDECLDIRRRKRKDG